MKRIRNMNRFAIVGFALIWLASWPTAHAVTPAPDGGYPGNNTAEGAAALASRTTGVNNTGLGTVSLYHDTSGSYNTASGSFSLLSNTTGHFHTAAGFHALYGNSIGGSNSAFGSYAMNSNISASGNTAVGWAALYSNTTGPSDTAVGYQALYRNTTGQSNTATGYQALYSNTAGTFDTAVGWRALYSSNGGEINTAVGNSALYNNTTGDYNTGVGSGALANNTTGGFNTAIGVSAGFNVTTASGVTCLGSAAAGANLANTTWIANVYNVPTQSGTTLPVVVSDTGQLGTAASAERFKKDIKPMQDTSEAILQLRPVMFHYKSDTTNTPQFGLVAEEVAELNPDLVVRDAEGEIYTVRYDAVNAMLLNEFLKEHRKVQELESALAAVNERLKEQDAKFDKVTAQVTTSGSLPHVAGNR
jgi:hypothetical protein